MLIQRIVAGDVETRRLGHEPRREGIQVGRALVAAAVDQIQRLGVLDNKILALNNQITKLNNLRMDIAGELGNPDANMSWFIEKAKEQAPEYVEALQEKKVKICKLISELTLLNNQNVELLKHGIIISNKMLETVINAFAPQGCFYNGAGKTDTHDVDMWTINEEI